MKFKLSVTLTCILILVGIASYTIQSEGKNQSPEPINDMIRTNLPIPFPRDPEPGNRSFRGDQFGRGDTLATVLARHDMSPSDVHYIGIALNDALPPNKIRAGSEVVIVRNIHSGQIEEIQIQKSTDVWVTVKNSSQGWVTEVNDHHLFVRTYVTNGIVTDSLWNAAMKRQIPAETILDLADLFGWQVDFTSGLRKGDTFSLIYQKRIVKDGLTLPGDILAAQFVNEGNEFFGYRQMMADGTTEYYDERHHSLRREFLKTPLRYRYISSGFSKSRFHPILKIYRPHLGIDFAAPTGTPVSSLGDGTVVFCGRKGGYGKYIQVKHGDAYETCYGHLSGYAPGIKKGARVSQGQVIGYVGSTGLSTGPHLDFRVKYRGSFINPNNIKSKPAAPLPDDLKEEFHLNCNRWKTILTEQGE